MIKRNLKTITLLLGAISSVATSSESFASNISNPLNNIAPIPTEQNITQNVIISAKIAPKTFYSIVDDNNRIVAKGKSDRKGIFITNISKSTLKNSKTLTLKDAMNNSLAERDYYQNDFITFSVEGTNNLQSWDDFNIAQTVVFILAKDPAWAVSFGLFVLFNLWAPEDDTPQKLEEILNKLSDIQAQIKDGFNESNQRFNSIFGHFVSNDMQSSFEASAIARDKLITIQNILQSSRYDAFWKDNSEKYKNIKDKNKADIEKLSKDFWPEVITYEQQKGIFSIDSIKNRMEKNYIDMKSDPFYKFDTKLTAFKNLISDAENSQSQSLLKDSISKINDETLKIDLGGDTSVIANICEGNTKAIEYNAWQNLVLNLSDLRLNYSAVINSGYIGAIKNNEELERIHQESLQKSKETVKNGLNNCTLFGSSQANGWPGVTFTGITKNGKYYLYVVVPIKDKLNLPSSDTLAFADNDNFRKKAFSEEQFMFFKTLRDKVYWDKNNTKERKSAYSNGNGLLIAYYSLNSSAAIDNSEALFGEKKPDNIDIKPRCSFNKCVFDISGVPSNEYKFNFPDREPTKLDEGSNTVTHTFPVKKWTKNTVVNAYAIVSNEKNENIKQINLALTMPKIPQYELEDHKIWTQQGYSDHITFISYGENLPNSFKFSNKSTAVQTVKSYRTPAEIKDYSATIDTIKNDYIDFKWRYPASTRTATVLSSTYSTVFENDAVFQTAKYKCSGLVRFCGDIEWLEPQMKYSL